MGISKSREDDTNLFYTFQGYYVINEPTGVATRFENGEAIRRAYQRDFMNVADHIAFHKTKRDIIWIQTLYGKIDNLEGHIRKILKGYNLPYRFHIIWHKKEGRLWTFNRYYLAEGQFIKDMSITPELIQEFRDWKRERKNNRRCAYDHPHQGKHKWIYD